MVAALALVVGVTVAPPGPAAEGTAVQVVDNEPDLTNWHFDPAELAVPVGATVVWHNRGHEDHSVTADDGSFDSGLKKPGTDFQRAFARAGKYTYHCQPHPWMKGVIRVGAVAAAAGATATTASTAPAAAATTTTVRAGSATTRAASAATTFPPALATPPGQSGGPTTTQAPASPASTPAAASGGSAAPAGKGSHSGAGLLGTLAVVLIPTFGALAVGARLRRSRP
jgi:plastocyanin